MNTIVETSCGSIRGRTKNGVNYYLGIPYAQSTAGKLRFAAPRPVEPWSGTRDATKFGPIAPQIDGADILLPKGTPQSEDCLTLNIWAPSDKDKPCPVMLWLHGGAYLMGASRNVMYNGRNLAYHSNVVVVTINYRLSAFGFLTHPDLSDENAHGACGNWGFLDQMAALRWVRENIAAFNGNPENITVFGNSAGGASACCLMTSPLAHGLFHRAIIQSGAPYGVITMDKAIETAEKLAHAAGVESVAELRKIPYDKLIQLASKIRNPDSLSGIPFTPSVDLGIAFLPAIDGTVLPKYPLDTMTEGDVAHIPVIIGTNRDECTIWEMEDPKAFNLNEKDLRKRLEQHLPGTDLEQVLAIYRSSRSARNEPTTPSDIWFAIESDRVFRIPSLYMADNLSAHLPTTYVYLFNWCSPLFGGSLGACHGLEMPFVFGTHNIHPGMAGFTGRGTAADLFSKNIMESWVAFARTGNPGTSALGDWPKYENSTRSTYIFGLELGVVQDPRSEERRILYELIK